MKRVLLSLSAIAVLLIGGCSGSDEPAKTDGTRVVPPTSTTSAPASSSTSQPPSTTAEAPLAPPPPVVEPEPEPVTFECGDPTLYQLGTAIYSDGSTGYEAACDTYVPPPADNQTGYPYDPSQDRNGDGVVNGYERCGLACGEEPTSGDIQTQYGCEQGYITGPACE
jgi:hypothetical protein